MFQSLIRAVIGDANDRIIKGMRRRVERINALEPAMAALDDAALAARTDAFRERLAKGADVDSLLEEAFATVREASRRALGMRHFDMQLIGGMALHQGMIAEMKTGEGKTLVATLAVYLNALSGKGAHVVTVNDYLASRDAAWMGRVYSFLGLTTGVITPGLDDAARRDAYACDITYGTNNEFGFDYLRDNLKIDLRNMVQRDFHFAIVDEVDSILIDEARTPLIISGPSEESTAQYKTVDGIIPLLSAEDWEKDEKARAVTLTEPGVEHVESLLRDRTEVLGDGGLYDAQNATALHHVTQALRAHALFTRDRDYIVENGRVVIIDEFTGRKMAGRRYGDGLHQALEAKESVEVQRENQTLASITFQNYFRMYPTLAGMTGTAMTEAAEFEEIYGLRVVSVPTNRTMVRADHDDEVYRTGRERDKAVLAEIRDCHRRAQPVLVGTASIERSEALSAQLKKARVPHQVLNARHHEREAHIIADAGLPGAVTIATNMAGRGTDIQLGGNLEMRLQRIEAEESDPEARAARAKAAEAEVEAGREKALAAGGLYVIGTERHESRRIDNQLRGRSGRQGDPGASKFYVSLEDDLMRVFGSERMDGILRRLGLEEGEAIIHPWVSKALEKAQQKVEARNFEMRKQILKFDDVMNDQRKVVFEQRRDLMRADSVHDTVLDMRADAVEGLVTRCMPPKAMPDQWDMETLDAECRRLFGLDLPVGDWAAEEGIADEEVSRRIAAALDDTMARKAADFGPETLRAVEKSVVLQILDTLWKEHLLQLDHLRQGIGLRAYAQRDPLNEYKREAFVLFEGVMSDLRVSVTRTLAHVALREPPPPNAADGAPAAQNGGPARASVDTASDSWGKVARNAPCPCGSGKKYKHCHGKV